MRATLGLTASLALAIAAGPASAHDLEAPHEHPTEEWRRVAPRDTDSTEACAGNPVTPLCAIDTVFACLHRGRPELCDTVMEVPFKRDSVTKEVPGRSTIYYRVVEIRHLRKGDIPEWRTRDTPGWSWKAEDLQVSLLQTDCSDTYCAPAFPPPTTFTLRRKSDGIWMVVDWETPRDED